MLRNIDASTKGMAMKLKELRKSRKLTQQNVADFLGIPYKTYQNYEREVREADSDILCKLADLYGVSLDALYGRQAEGTTEPQTFAPDELQLIAFYRRMTDEDKQTFMNNAQVFAIAGDAKKESDAGNVAMVGKVVSADD